MNDIKVIQIMPEFGLAGAEIMVENLVKELKSKVREVIVLSLYDYHSPITERIEIIEFTSVIYGFNFSA